LTDEALQKQEDSMTDRWMTTKETVLYLSLPSRAALYMAVRRGQIPAHKLGARLRFRKQELDACLQKTVSPEFEERVSSA